MLQMMLLHLWKIQEQMDTKKASHFLFTITYKYFSYYKFEVTIAL